jgi:hypothetical protein
MSAARMTNRIWPRLHLVIGIAGLIAFLLTGQYMDRWLGHLDGMADAPRALYRSAHIYILFSALLNVLLGTYVVPVRGGLLRALQILGSLLLLATPALFLYGFIVETPPAVIERPMIRESIYCALGGVLMHGLAVLCHHVGRDRPHSVS